MAAVWQRSMEQTMDVSRVPRPLRACSGSPEKHEREKKHTKKTLYRLYVADFGITPIGSCITPRVVKEVTPIFWLMPEVLLRAVRGEIKPTTDKKTGLYQQFPTALKNHKLPIVIIGMTDTLPPAAVFVSSRNAPCVMRQKRLRGRICDSKTTIILGNNQIRILILYFEVTYKH